MLQDKDEFKLGLMVGAGALAVTEILVFAIYKTIKAIIGIFI